MKLLLTFFAVLLLTSGVAYLALNEPGYVLLSYGSKSLELPLIDFIIGLFLLFIAFYLLLRLWHSVTHVPANLSKLRHKQQKQKSRHNLMQGLVEYIEGKWPQAEEHLLHSAERSGAPLLNYLAAAHAAQHQNAIERRDDYLLTASERHPAARIAVGLVKADLQTRQQSHEDALDTLQQLHSEAPKHKIVSKQLARQYHQQGHWQQLHELLPELRKNDSLSSEERNNLEQQTFAKLLEQSTSLDSATALWKKAPKALRNDPQLVAHYAHKLNEHGKAEQVEPLIRNTLNKHWDDTLVTLYGQLKLSNSHATLSQLDDWIQKQPKNIALLNAAATQNARAQIWGKTRSLLQESLNTQPTAEAYQALGNLHEQLQENSEAKNAYHAGFSLLMQQQNAPAA